MSDPHLITPGQANPQQTNLYDATQQLGLTPQEQYLYQHHLRNMYMGGYVINDPHGPEPSVSTLRQAVVTGPDGRYYNIPTVWGGQVLPVPLATQMARSYGWDKWPSYSTPDAADARYTAMHSYLDRDGKAFLQQQGLMPDGDMAGRDGGDNQPDLQRPVGQAPGNR